MPSISLICLQEYKHLNLKKPFETGAIYVHSERSRNYPAEVSDTLNVHPASRFH